MNDDQFEFLLKVSQAGHELVSIHGPGAWKQAEKRVADASRRGDAEENKFWQAVANSVKPRTAVE
jgi:hypothetical protein